MKKNFLQLVCGVLVSGVNSTYGMETLSAEMVEKIVGMSGSSGMLAERIEQYCRCALVCVKWKQFVCYLVQKVKKDFADLSDHHKAWSLREGIFLNTTYETLSFLLRYGADLQRSCYSSMNGSFVETAWEYASRKKNAVALKCFVAHGANINSQESLDVYGNGGYTALMIASSDDDLQSVILLLNHGADCLIKNSFGKTAYECAKNSIIKQLLQDRMAVQKAAVMMAARADQAEPPIYAYV